MSGCLEILNVQSGDIKLTYDTNDAAEAIRARRIVSDMLRRGYAILVDIERDGERKYERILEFRENTGEFMIADFDSLEAAKVDSANPDPPNTVVPNFSQDEGRPKRGRPRGSYKKKAVPMSAVNATAVAPRRGG